MGEYAISEGTFELSWDTVDDAKSLLEQGRGVKAGLQAERRALATQMAEIRAEYRERVAHRIPGRKKGIFGAIVQAKRAGDRASTNESIRPLERQKQELDERLVDVDRVLLQLRSWITEHGGSRASAAAKPTTAAVTAVDATSGILAAIEGLAALRDRGVLTEDEFTSKKAALLERL